MPALKNPRHEAFAQAAEPLKKWDKLVKRDAAGFD
jgi:hypothetical protein